MRHTLVILFFLQISIFFSFGQDPLSSHFFLNTPVLNPALTGSADARRIFANYRNQWPGLHSALMTYTGCYDQPSSLWDGGLGVAVKNDVIANGLFNTVNADFMYSYHLQVSREWYVLSGIEASLVNKNIRASSLQYFPDAPEAIPSRSSFLADFSLGFAAFHKDLVIGTAFHHIANTAFYGDDTYTMPLRISAHASNAFHFHPYTVTSSILIEQQEQSFYATYGAGLNYQEFTTGVWLRQDEKFHFSALIFALRYSTSLYTVIYSYDFPFMNSRKGINYGAHEVTFLAQFKYKTVTKKKFKAVKCPSL